MRYNFFAHKGNALGGFAMKLKPETALLLWMLASTIAMVGGRLFGIAWMFDVGVIGWGLFAIIFLLFVAIGLIVHFFKKG
jgi:hypothetical protein